MFNAIKTLHRNLISCRSCSTLASAELKPFGFARAIITGRVIKEPFVFENGAKALLLRSNDTKYGTTVTRVQTASNANITEGQQLYVAGYLHSTEFFNANDKRRFEFSVRSTETSIIRPCDLDINFVELRAVVLNEIYNTAEYSTFRVATRFLSRTKEELQSSFFSVRVYDEALRDLVRENLTTSNVIRLQGKHQALIEMNKDAKPRHSSYIRASNIMIIATRAKLAQSANDNAADEIA